MEKLVSSICVHHKKWRKKLQLNEQLGTMAVIRRIHQMQCYCSATAVSGCRCGEVPSHSGCMRVFKLNEGSLTFLKYQNAAILPMAANKMTAICVMQSTSRTRRKQLDKWWECSYPDELTPLHTQRAKYELAKLHARILYSLRRRSKESFPYVQRAKASPWRASLKQ